MKVQNNMPNPYMLCGFIVAPNCRCDISEGQYNEVTEIAAIKVLFDNKLLEVIKEEKEAAKDDGGAKKSDKGGAKG